MVVVCARARGRKPETIATAAKMEGILIVKKMIAIRMLASCGGAQRLSESM